MSSTSPMIRPMSLAQLLDRAIGLYRQNFFKFIGIIAVPYIPLMLIQMGLSFFTTRSMMGPLSDPSSVNPLNPSVLLASAGSILITFFQFILVRGVATAALTRAVSDNYTGNKIEILGSYQKLNTSWLRLIFALILMAIVVIGVFIWMIIPCVGWITGPGLFFFIALAVNPLIAPIVVLENMSASASIRRAWDLARSRFWWLLGCVIVLTFFGQLIVSGPVFLLNILLQFLMSLYPSTIEQQFLISTILQNLITMSTSLLYLPLQLTIMTVVYFDLRARSEGLDLALQISAGAENETDVVQLPEISTKSQMPFFTMIDAGRFSLLSLAGVAVYFFVVSLVAGLVFLAVPTP
jgi:hypothetical protein